MDVYTFGEALKVLGITSNEFNELISSKKLVPVRHQGRLKFKKEDVERLLKEQQGEQVPSSSSEEEFYSWNEALRILQLEEEDLERLIEDGDITVENGKRFRKSEIDKWIEQKCSDNTIVVNRTPPSYYNMAEVMKLLQIEQEELDFLLNEGILAVSYDKGEMKFDKQVVDEYRDKCHQDATVVISAQDIEEEDEPAQPLSLPSKEEDEESDEDAMPLPNIIEPDMNSSHYEDDSESEIVQPEIIEAEESSESSFYEPEVISPEEDDDESEMIESEVISEDESEEEEERNWGDFEQKKKPELGERKLDQVQVKNPEKSFLSYPEAAAYLKISEKELSRTLEKRNVPNYLFQNQKHVPRKVLVPIYAERASKDPALLEELLEETSSPASPASEEGYYTLEEVTKLLQVDEQKIRVMVGTGKLRFIREGKSFKFPRDLVNRLVKEQAKNPPSRHSSSLSSEQEKQALEQSLDNLADEEEAQKSQEGEGIEATMVLPLPDMEEEDDDDMVMLGIPAPSSTQKNPEDYYTFSQVQEVLQLEQAELERLISQGKLSCVTLAGKKRVPKKQVEELRIDKMIEPTIVVNEGESEEDILEEDDGDIFFLGKNKKKK